MLMPDCRDDAFYNEKFLNDTDKNFVRGFDWCAETAVDTFFENLVEVFGEDSYIVHQLNEELPENMKKEEVIEFTFGNRDTENRKVNTYMDMIRSKLIDWMESQRDELIVSMLDSMDEAEYEKNRTAAMKNAKPDEFRDTRSFMDRR